MPLQNRVCPDGTIETNPARGSLMGNRGVLHNFKQQITSHFKNKAWITCALAFKGRKRQLMSPGHYTELFFLDEVTAFAAGHRPCAECRRARYKEFRDIWGTANGLTEKVRAPELDKVLHEQRLTDGTKAVWQSALADLPHGTMFRVSDQHYAIFDGTILAWNFTGYHIPQSVASPETVEVLTPWSVVQAFLDGFRPAFHPSARA